MYTISSLLLPAERACKYAVNIAASADSSCPPRVDAASALNRSAVACPYNSDCWPSQRAAWYPLHAVATATIASTATSMISATASQRALLCCSPSFCSLSLCEISTLWPSGIATSFRAGTGGVGSIPTVGQAGRGWQSGCGLRRADGSSRHRRGGCGCGAGGGCCGGLGWGAGLGLLVWRGEWAGAEQGEGEEGAAGQDGGGPPEGGGVAVDQGLGGQLRAGPAVDEGGGGGVGGEVGGDGTGEDGVEQGGADRAAELLAGVDRGRGHAGIAGRDAEGAGVEYRREDQAQAGADDQQGGQDGGGVAGVHADPGQQGQAGGGEQHPGRGQRPGPGPRHEHDVGGD